jgi:hypothetical protein
MQHPVKAQYSDRYKTENTKRPQLTFRALVSNGVEHLELVRF